VIFRNCAGPRVDVQNIFTRREQSCKKLGIAILLFAFFRQLNGFLRSHKDHRNRNVWKNLHQFPGRGLILAAIANVFLGLGREFLSNFNVSSTDESDTFRNDNPLFFDQRRFESAGVFCCRSVDHFCCRRTRFTILLQRISNDEVVFETLFNLLVIQAQLILCVLATLRTFVVYDQIALLFGWCKGIC